jgi:TRAP-type C4-dicarboxylate transport system permease small subunit
MDEKEIEKLKKDNEWYKFDNKLSNFLFTIIMAAFSLCSVSVLNILAICGADAALLQLPPNPLATSFMQICIGVSTLILFALIAFWVIERIVNNYGEEIKAFFESIKKYRLVKDEEKSHD